MLDLFRIIKRDTMITITEAFILSLQATAEIKDNRRG